MITHARARMRTRTHTHIHTHTHTHTHTLIEEVYLETFFKCICTYCFSYFVSMVLNQLQKKWCIMQFNRISSRTRSIRTFGSLNSNTLSTPRQAIFKKEKKRTNRRANRTVALALYIGHMQWVWSAFVQYRKQAGLLKTRTRYPVRTEHAVITAHSVRVQLLHGVLHGTRLST